ncbi:L,D-transpeptidase family protein [Raineyella fluvialis]|uniref:L,D-transpeptidase family protein n=1 Tax=Raineyella fluvialis TaxID=2662261 RepID=A0A5Q2FCN4_9ACTN|nr:L,D-transpeptidase family protein [Raineyella fluvialis]QGF24682.1 L,D-transpeptidase family protein [Raineyella fluvialis]
MSTEGRIRGGLVGLVTALVLLVSACAPPTMTGSAATPGPDAVSSVTSSSTPEPESTATPSPATATPSQDATPSPTPTQSPSPAAPAAGPALMSRGSSGSGVKDLQARLKQIGWFSGNVTGFYGDATVTAVSGFQARRGLPVTGNVDQATLDRLRSMTRTPTAAELSNTTTTTSSTAGLDPRCLTGRAICISKSRRQLVWVVDGVPRMRMDVRFGSELTPTREGSFQVEWKARDWVSTIYHTPMPFSMFFSGGQAVHYSADFAARGYNGSSHGCVNVRDYIGIAALFDQVQVGDAVIVYQ